MQLCLDSLTLNDTEPPDLIRSARSAGFDLVSLWVQPPSIFPSQLVTPAKAKACEEALKETGMRVGPLEVFDMRSAEAIKSYRPALELGARLGAKSASAINVVNQDAAQVSELFAQFAELAFEYGFAVTLEPLATFATARLSQARDIIRASGVNAGIVLDILHLVREGGTVADVRAMELGLIRYIQVCDGAATLSPEELRIEAAFERRYPGEGDFPLIELLRDAPTDITWGVEAPSRRRAATGTTAEMQAKAAIAAVRKLVADISAAKQNASRP